MAIIGDPFEEYVTNQINLRQKSLGEGFGGETRNTSRKLKTLNIYNSSTPFMRLASAVSITKGLKDLPGESVYEQIKRRGLFDGFGEDVWKGPELAKNFVLQGAPNSIKSGVNISNNAGKAYGFGYGSSQINSEQGYVPPPGVTNVEFEYKNDGALAFATISVKAFSATQFSMIDILYMRPGYTCLLEFGHSMYYNNKEELVNLDTANTAPFQYLFSKPASVSYTAMAEKISNEKKKHDGNYEAFFGRISKFNWKFNMDGSYDITVKLMGLGDVISSLKVTLPKMTKTPSSFVSSFALSENFEEPEEGDTDFLIGNAQTSQLNFELYAIFKIPYNQNEPSFSLEMQDIPVGGKNKSFTLTDSGAKFDVNDTIFTRKEYSPITSIKFGVFLSILQKICNITNGKSNQLLQFEMVDDLSYGPEEQLKRDDTFIATYPGNFSSNPNICLIKHFLYDNDKVVVSGEFTTDTLINNALSLTSREGEGNTMQKLENPSLAMRLSDVYIDINFITKVISGLRGTDEESDDEITISVIDLLRGVLSGVNTCLGGINNFRILYTEATCEIQIVSETPILNQKITSSTLTRATINTFGFNTIDEKLIGGSFVTSMDLNSELTDQMATQISIGAQNGGSTINANATSFSSYNKGLIDTLFEKKESNLESVTPPTGSEENQPKSVEEKIETILEESKFLSAFEQVYNDFEFDPESYIATLESSVSSLSPLFQSLYTLSGNSPAPFFLPFNLSLEMHGLAGMKIFNSFSIEGKGLPLSYNPKNIKLVIKSLSHTVSLEGWKTKVQTISTPVFDVTATAVTSSPAGSNPYKGGGGGGGGGGGDVSGARENLNYKGEKLDYDPAPIINPTHIGADRAEKTPVFEARGLNLRSTTSPSKIFALANEGKLTLIGDATTNTNFTKGSANLASVKLLNNKYYLEPKAAQQFKKWTDELNTNGIPWRCTSAVRFGRNTGGGPHGFGVAVDFGNLWRVVKGSHAPPTNVPGRKTKIYEDIATAGAKYGWYNPWRLSDVRGTYDEIWHFEYWGPA